MLWLLLGSVACTSERKDALAVGLCTDAAECAPSFTLPLGTEADTEVRAFHLGDGLLALRTLVYVRLFDTTASPPAELGSVHVGYGTGVAVGDGLVFTAVGDTLAVLDTSDPTAPVLRGAVALEATVGVATSDLDLLAAGHIAYVLDTVNERLFVVDASEPDAPVVAASVPVPGDRMALSDGILWVGGSGRITAFDLSVTPPVERGWLDPTGSLDQFGVGDGRVVSSSWRSGSPDLFEVWDVADPGSPALVDSIEWSKNNCGGGQIAVLGDVALLDCNELMRVDLATGSVTEDRDLDGHWLAIQADADGFIAMPMPDQDQPSPFHLWSFPPSGADPLGPDALVNADGRSGVPSGGVVAAGALYTSAEDGVRRIDLSDPMQPAAGPKVLTQDLGVLSSAGGLLIGGGSAWRLPELEPVDLALPALLDGRLQPQAGVDGRLFQVVDGRRLVALDVGDAALTVAADVALLPEAACTEDPDNLQVCSLHLLGSPSATHSGVVSDRYFYDATGEFVIETELWLVDVVRGRSVPLGLPVDGFAVGPDRAYATDTGTLSVIDLASGTVVNTVDALRARQLMVSDGALVGQGDDGDLQSWSLADPDAPRVGCTHDVGSRDAVVLGDRVAYSVGLSGVTAVDLLCDGGG